MDITISTQFLVLVPVLIGVVQVVKSVGLTDRYAPLCSLILGVAGAFLIGGQVVSALVLQGIIAGLTASGLWSGTKATING